MADAVIVILPVIRIERAGVDLRRNRLCPKADRHQIVELWRARLKRDLDETLADGSEAGPDQHPEPPRAA